MPWDIKHLRTAEFESPNFESWTVGRLAGSPLADFEAEISTSHKSAKVSISSIKSSRRHAVVKGSFFKLMQWESTESRIQYISFISCPKNEARTESGWNPYVEIVRNWKRWCNSTCLTVSDHTHYHPLYSMHYHLLDVNDGGWGLWSGTGRIRKRPRKRGRQWKWRWWRWWRWPL